jgi:hypothetical protein
MSGCPEAAGTRACLGPALAALCLLALWPASGRAQPPPAPEPQTPEIAPGAAPEAAPEAAPQAAAPPRFLSARVRIRELTEAGTETHAFQVQKFGNRVRMEPDRPGDPRFTPETLYDYDKRESYRLLADDRITFSYVIPLRDRVLAQIEGLMTTPPEEPVYRLEVNPDVTFDGHPCTLVLAGFPSPLGRIHALRWVWEARDLDGQPVKVVFPQGDGSVLIVEYLDASGAPFDPARVQPPPDRPVMSGF